MARCPLPLFLLLPAFLGAGRASAQGDGGRVEILHADRWDFDEHIAPGAQRLLGHVRFKHVDAVMHCDSAYLYEDQRVEAFGHVRIEQGDTLSVASHMLNYEGRERVARLAGDVRLRDHDMELSTPSLTYDLRAKQATFTEGGRIVSHSDGNTLTSRAGTYLADVRTFIFRGDVRLEHPDRLILSDTMHYATMTGITSFYGPTRILQHVDSMEIHTLRGTYDTRKGRASFDRRSSIRSKGRLLEGDSLEYDRSTGLGLARGNVSLTDTGSNLMVHADQGRYNDLEERSMMTGRAELVLAMDGDTLYLHADSLFTERRTMVDSLGRPREGHRIQAHRGVRFYKSDMQGACDTLIHDQADSLIRMYHAPVLWSNADQITGRHIRIALRNGRAHLLYVNEDAFLMSRVDSSRFDQVTGTTMTGHFGEEGLRRLIAEGNSRTVYFAREKKEGVEEIIGVNRADCSRIEVTVTEGGIDSVTFLERPEAILYPLDKVPPEELRMKGSNWREQERPMDRWDIFRR